MNGNQTAKTFLCAIALFAGECAGFSLGNFCAEWKTFAFFSFFGFLHLWGSGAKKLLVPAFFAAGIVLGAKSDALRRETLSALEGARGQPPAIELKIESDISLYTRKNGTKAVTFLSTAGNQPLKVSAPLDENGPLPRRGETWKCKGWISSKGMASGRFFDRRFFWIGRTDGFSKVENASPGDIANFYAKANKRLSGICGLGLDRFPELANLNKAILLGNRSLMAKEMRSDFADAGTIHVFAISGLHIMLVAGVIRTILKRLGFAGSVETVLTVPALVAFVILSGSKPSAIRALAMAVLMLTAPLFGRRPNPLCAWSVTLVAIYGLRPEMVFDIGCTLSFAVMLGIAFVLGEKNRIDTISTMRGAKKSAADWAKADGVFADLIPGWTGLAVSLASWAMALPLTGMFFGKISFGGLLANLIVVKLAGFSVRLGFGALCIAAISIPLAAVLNNCCALCTWLMVRVSRFTARLPFACVEVPPWTPAECLLWYAGCFLVFKLAFRIAAKKVSGKGNWWKRHWVLSG